MNPSDISLSPLKRRDGEPAFDEAWQAQALAMADLMVQSGVISADAWAQALGGKLRISADTGTADDTETYYRAVLNALEELLADADATLSGEVTTREKEWRSAYLNTPHGEPVELCAAHEYQFDGHGDDDGNSRAD